MIKARCALGGLIEIENILKSFKYVRGTKLSTGESVKLTVNGLLVLVNLVSNYAPAFYIIDYGNQSFEHIAGRKFENMNLTVSFDEKDLVITSNSVNGAQLYYAYQSMAL